MQIKLCTRTAIGQIATRARNDSATLHKYAHRLSALRFPVSVNSLHHYARGSLGQTVE